MTQALVCTDKADAMRQLDDLACGLGRTLQVLEVRDVWRVREALQEGAAARDPVIAAFMAGCLVEASLGPNPLEPPEPAAEDYLRKALTDSSDAVVYAAMVGLTNVLTTDDIVTIVRLASARSALAVPGVALLSTDCVPEAKAAVGSIRAAYPGSPKAAEIDQFLAQSGDLCSPTGHPIPKEFMARIAVPLTAEGVRPPDHPTAMEVKAALDSQSPPTALHVLLGVQCAPTDTETVGEMRQAWRERDLPAASAAARDPVIQAVIAQCLIRAGRTSRPLTKETLDAAVLLRTSILGDDVMAVVAAVEGLAIVNAEQDIQLIADVPKRNPLLLNHVIRVVGFTCGANNLKTIELMRKEAANEALRGRIDSVYSHVAPTRLQTCGAGG